MIALNTVRNQSEWDENRFFFLCFQRDNEMLGKKQNNNKNVTPQEKGNKREQNNRIIKFTENA